MGCDGGTIPTRDELVTLKKKPEKKDKNADLAAKWKHCAISQEPLQPPIVACQLGRLYKKDKVIEFLLDKSKFEQAENFDHIKGLKDIKELQLTDNATYKRGKAEKGDGYTDYAAAEYICPVTGLEMSGTFRFVFIWTCACVFAERAMKVIKSDVCHKCQKPYKQGDVIILNGTDDDFKQMRANMEERKLQAKLEKKSKKKHKIEAAQSSAGEPESKQAKTELDKPSTSSEGACSKLTNGTASKITNGASKLNGPAKTTKLVNGQKERTSQSVQKDTKATVAFKSLFTTSEKAKNQPKGNWVTYNPFYF